MSWFLITFSSVTKFPKMLILSTKNFSVSVILNDRFNLLEVKSSITVAFINLYCSIAVISSISFKILSILLIE